MLEEQVDENEVGQVVHDKHLVLAARCRPGSRKGRRRIENDHVETDAVRSRQAAELAQRFQPAQIAIPHLDARGSALANRALTCFGNLRAARHGHPATATGNVHGEGVPEARVRAGNEDPLAVETIGIGESGRQRLFAEAVLETRQRGDHRIVEPAVRHQRFAVPINEKSLQPGVRRAARRS